MGKFVESKSVDTVSEENFNETWIGAESTAISCWLTKRSAAIQAAFFLPQLSAGMNLLDCGCGPGTITADLARLVMPGQVVGIDFDPSKVEQARTHLRDQKLTNLRFETADIHALPFADNAFDAVFSNAVLTYSPAPLVALREIHRVLKSGGVVGIRNVDYDGHLFTPISSSLTRWWDLVIALQKKQGSNPYFGKQQRALCQQAGFIKVQASATYECYGTPQTARNWGEVMAEALREGDPLEQAIKLGCKPAEIEEMHKAWLEWREHPDAFFADSYCETVGWKV